MNKKITVNGITGIFSNFFEISSLGGGYIQHSIKQKTFFIYGTSDLGFPDHKIAC